MLFSQNLEAMKEITLRVPDTMARMIEDWTNYVPEMELVRMVDNMMSEDVRDLCTRCALDELIDEKAIRRPRDYAWIMLAMNQGVIDDFDGFCSHQDYIDYLKEIGIGTAPSRTTLFNIENNTLGDYPEWTFLDEPSPNESLRRKNLVKLFLSAYRRAKREKLNS